MPAGVAVDANPGRGVVLAGRTGGLLGRGHDECAADALVGRLTRKTQQAISGPLIIGSRAATYRLLGQHGAGPVGAVRDTGVGGVRVGVDAVLRELNGLVGERLVGDTVCATSDAGGKTLLRGGDGEGRGGEDDLAEERSNEHGEIKG